MCSFCVFTAALCPCMHGVVYFKAALCPRVHYPFLRQPSCPCMHVVGYFKAAVCPCVLSFVLLLSVLYAPICFVAAVRARAVRPESCLHAAVQSEPWVPTRVFRGVLGTRVGYLRYPRCWLLGAVGTHGGLPRCPGYPRWVPQVATLLARRSRGYPR